MSNNDNKQQGHKQGAAEAVVARGAGHTRAGEEGQITGAKAPVNQMPKSGWLDNGFLGSKRTTNRDVMVEGTMFVGMIVVGSLAVAGTAYVVQKLFGGDTVADAALIGGSVSLS